MPDFQRALAAFEAGQFAAALEGLSVHLAPAASPSADVAWLAAQCLEQLGEPAKALNRMREALEDPSFATPARYLAMGHLSLSQGERDEAMLAGLKARRLSPEDLDANAFLFDLMKEDEDKSPLESLVPPLLAAARPEDLNRLILALGADRNNPLSLDLFKRLAALYPERDDYKGVAFLIAREFCDVDYMDALAEAVPLERWASEPGLIGAEIPLDNIYWCGDERINRLAGALPGGPAPVADPDARRAIRHDHTDGRIRIGYLSSDFFAEHATMRLLADVLKKHDRSRFDITLFCHTVPELAARDPDRVHYGRIILVHDLDDEQLAARIRQEGIDILVDLKGHTGDTRTNVLNLGCAPVQVGWLGFPGSTIDIDLDYIISDRFVTPPDSAPHYHEKFCLMPNSYQPNDPNRPDPPPTPRAELRLPDSAFVFACFNSPRKLNSRVLNVWSEILKGAPHAVLWLVAGNMRLATNVRRRFHALGIDPGRILFAPMLPIERHLARLKAADLALDPFPCNGHTTTSDALWAGLPVVALKGTSFASRVSESLLNAVGVPDMIAADEAAYIALATSLANEPGRIRAVRERLADNRLTSPLYDSRRFALDLERAYGMMHARANRGLPPENFAVPEA